jgi:hypothetical protein
MAKRPGLSEDTFLAHLFSPSKQPLPSGLRKTTLKGTKGQTKSRLNAFNRMAPFKQEVLKRSGTRDSYLRGQTTLADAKRALRPQAIAKKLAKPTKQRIKPTPVSDRRRKLDEYIAAHLKRTVRNAGRPVNDRTVDAEIVWLGDDADTDMLLWGYGQIKYAGRKGSEYEKHDDDGHTHNPFWYH